MVDYHLHTSRCCHATGTPEEYLAAAEEQELHEIGFADHYPLGLLGCKPRSQVTMHPEELPEYIMQVEKLRAASKTVRVKLGVEVDFLPGTEQKTRSLLQAQKFDYVIGSIHFLGDWDFTHPIYADHYQEKDLTELYSRYFSLVWDLCYSRLFDIVGHIDVIKKFGYRPQESLEPYWVKTAQVLSETGTCLELNTAGRDAPVGDFYPDRRLLEICHTEGVRVTIGSDAHSPEQVGRYMPEALDLLKSVGYREITAFDQRKKSSVPLY